MYEDNFDFEKYARCQEADPELGDYAARLIRHGIKKPRRGKNNDKAHPPIHPLKGGNDLAGLERSVFLYITRRYLASLSDDAIFEEALLAVRVGDETFHTKGRRIIAKNYLDVFVYDKISENSIPKLATGSRVDIVQLTVNQGETSAPDLLSESDLIGIMDKNGIGTDATIHEHIQKVIDRGYATCGRGRFTPTPLGVGLVIGYDNYGFEMSLTKPAARAELEKDLQGVCDGRTRPASTIESHIARFRRSLTLIMADFRAVIGAIDFYKSEVSLNLTGSGASDGSTDKGPKGRKKKGNSSSAQERPKSFKRPPAKLNRNPSQPSLIETVPLADGEVKCDCGLIAPVFTSKKPESAGRRFATCGKKVHRCKFFQWLS